jgi:hypothetical protein
MVERTLLARAVWKFALGGQMTRIEMDPNAVLLGARVQQSVFGEGLMLWALVDPDAPKVERRFVVAPTGASVLGEVAYVSSLEMSGGVMLHVFEVLS